MPSFPFIEKLIELNRHLEVLDPVIESFAQSHGYRNVPAVERGRRPLREVRKDEEICFWIGYELIPNESGGYCEEFTPIAPFHYRWMMCTERGSTHVRIDWAFENPVPFSVLKTSLSSYLELAAVMMSNVTLDELLRDGCKIDRNAKFTLEDAKRFSAQVRYIKT